MYFLNCSNLKHYVLIAGRKQNVGDEETDENFESESQAEEINTPSHVEETQEQVEDEPYEYPISPSLPLPNTPQSSRSSSVENSSRPVSRAVNTKSISLSKKTNTQPKKTEAKKTETLPDILKEYVQDKKRFRLEKQALATGTQSTDGKNSALLEFFTSMAKTTATFPPLWQAKVKSKVFEMVNSYELALLQNSSASPAPPPLLIESHTPTQHQSQIQDMHNVAMQSSAGFT